MAIKAVNDSAGIDRIIPTLLVFRAYPRMTKDSPLSLSTTQRAKAIHKATKEVRRLYAERRPSLDRHTREALFACPVLIGKSSAIEFIWCFPSKSDSGDLPSGKTKHIEYA
jgi:hypothetical protein